MKFKILICSLALLFPFAVQSAQNHSCSSYDKFAKRSVNTYHDSVENSVKFAIEGDKITSKVMNEYAKETLLEAAQWATLYIAFCKK